MSIRPVVVGGLLLWGAAVVAAAVAGGGRATSSPPARNALATTIPAAGVSSLELVAGEGQVDVGVTSADQIEIAVALESRLNGATLIHGVAADAARTSLDAAVSGHAVRARVTGALGEGLVERWTVRVPARLAADVTLRHGDIHITGLEGGVHASTDSGFGHDAGAIDVDVPRGSLTLTMGMGTIHARIGATPPGTIDVQSRVGRARLALDGHNLDTDHEPGPGERVRLTGDGTEGVRVHVSVGDAFVTIR